MRVIPVIDLMGGQVVRGVAGRRDEYRPIESRLAADPRPTTVGHALAARGFRDVYLADLDAIGGAEPAWRVYEELMRCGLALWVDAGLTRPEAARAMTEFTVNGARASAIVTGLESLADAETLRRIGSLVGPKRMVFSLDLKAGAPLNDRAAWRGLTPLAIADVALRAGVRRMIVLDLAAVGIGQGVPTLSLCRALRCRNPELEIVAGGGVRDSHDLEVLSAAGCNAALVASALHDGRLSADACAAMR